MIVKDGVVSYIGVEGSGEFGKSKAETILEELKK
jgi:peroxiredoxin